MDPDSTATGQFLSELECLVRARYPIIQINTHEEDRCLRTLRLIARRLELRIIAWSASRGCHCIGPPGDPRVRVPKAADLAAAIEFFESQAAAQNHDAHGDICVLLDPYPYLSESGVNPIYRRRLRDFAINIRAKGYRATCVLVSPVARLPAELEKEVTVIDFPLPDRHEVHSYLLSFAEMLSNRRALKVDCAPGVIDKLVDASLGLTLMEIERALSRAMLENSAFSADDIDRIFREKQQIVRKSGVLEYVDTRALTLSEIGGLNSFKEWLRVRAATLSPRARAFGIEPPKGVLVTGVPGCGKSWSAKCVAASWHLPLVRLDMGRVYSALVGSSEEHMRDAIRVAEAIAPCVLWIDEIEKGLPHARGYVGDSGVSRRVLGKFLTWMQEKTEPVFVFATANQIDQLPPEILRKGRFDEVFFVDLPNDEERREIIEINLRRANATLGSSTSKRLVRLSGPAQFGADASLTGAEIAAWVNEALIRAFDRQAALVMDDFRTVARQTVPLAQMREDEIRAMREWAFGHAAPATAPTFVGEAMGRE